jgi:DNA-binding response OmpR family regulator
MMSRHILIVEDEKKIADLLCDYLKAAGFRTSTQNNGERVIAQIKKDPSDLILLDYKTHQVMIDKQVLNLTPNEFGLLKILMSQPNRVFSRSELINRVQGYDFEGYDRTIDTHIKNLRKKIAQKLPGQEIISTVYGVGYKFSASAD